MKADLDFAGWKNFYNHRRGADAKLTVAEGVRFDQADLIRLSLLHKGASASDYIKVESTAAAVEDW